MGLVGKWIDSLSDAQRDRIIEHPDPTFRGWAWWDEGRDCGCLVGCVVGEGVKNGVFKDARISSRVSWSTRRALYSTGLRFPVLVNRFGAERMWRVCKARAAKRNCVNVEARHRELAGRA